MKPRSVKYRSVISALPGGGELSVLSEPETGQRGSQRPAREAVSGRGPASQHPASRLLRLVKTKEQCLVFAKIVELTAFQ